MLLWAICGGIFVGIFGFITFIIFHFISRKMYIEHSDNKKTFSITLAKRYHDMAVKYSRFDQIKFALSNVQRADAKLIESFNIPRKAMVNLILQWKDPNLSTFGIFKSLLSTVTIISSFVDLVIVPMMDQTADAGLKLEEIGTELNRMQDLELIQDSFEANKDNDNLKAALDDVLNNIIDKYKNNAKSIEAAKKATKNEELIIDIIVNENLNDDNDHDGFDSKQDLDNALTDALAEANKNERKLKQVCLRNLSELSKSIVSYLLFHSIGVTWSLNSLNDKSLTHILHRIFENVIGLFLILVFAFIEFDCHADLCANYKIRNLYSNFFALIFVVVFIITTVVSPWLFYFVHKYTYTVEEKIENMNRYFSVHEEEWDEINSFTDLIIENEKKLQKQKRDKENQDLQEKQREIEYEVQRRLKVSNYVEKVKSKYKKRTQKNTKRKGKSNHNKHNIKKEKQKQKQKHNYHKSTKRKSKNKKQKRRQKKKSKKKNKRSRKSAAKNNNDITGITDKRIRTKPKLKSAAKSKSKTKNTKTKSKTKTKTKTKSKHNNDKSKKKTSSKKKTQAKVKNNSKSKSKKNKDNNQITHKSKRKGKSRNKHETRQIQISRVKTHKPAPSRSRPKSAGTATVNRVNININQSSKVRHMRNYSDNFSHSGLQINQNTTNKHNINSYIYNHDGNRGEFQTPQFGQDMTSPYGLSLPPPPIPMTSIPMAISNTMEHNAPGMNIAEASAG